MKELNLPDDVNVNEEISVAILGSVDAGKSSLVGILTNSLLRNFNTENLNKCLDDGDGKARSTVLHHAHEKESGRTSSITYNYMLLEEANKPKRIVSFIDLPGHESYLKSSITGITNSYPDFVFICIEKITRITYEHIQLAIYLNLPIAIIYTKIDTIPEDKLKKNIKKVNKCMKSFNKFNLMIRSVEDVDFIDDDNIIPSFKISNKTGEGFPFLINFIKKINKRNIIIPNLFSIDHVYNIPGYGTVLSGITGLEIKKGDNLFIGPFENNDFKPIKIRTIHDDYRNFVDFLHERKRGCICININKNFKNHIKSRMIIVKNPNIYKTILSKSFKASVFIFHHSTTIKVGYQTFMNAPNIQESVILKEIFNEKNLLRTGSRELVSLEFIKNKYYLQVGQHFIFREGKSMGVGRIVEI